VFIVVALDMLLRTVKAVAAFWYSPPLAKVFIEQELPVL
jgi:hypothetical protein